MKTTFITIITFFLMFLGCANQKMMMDNQTEIVRATFSHWSEAPPVRSDVRERGTDLELIVDNWPEGAVPEYFIFRKMQSFPAEITDSTEAGLKIFARIIRTSAVMEETSKRAELTDRLVFRQADGEWRFVEISEWSRMEE